MPFEEDKLVPHEEITNKKDAKTEPSATETHKNTLQRWADPNKDGRRLNRMIRYLETKMKKCKLYIKLYTIYHVWLRRNRYENT